MTKYGNVSMFNETSEVLCVKDLYPGETYTVNVSAYTDVGNGPAATIDVTTIPLGMYCVYHLRTRVLCVYIYYTNIYL